MDLTEIGFRIKAERKKRGLSQEQLAEMINVSSHYIYEIERGLKAMSLETLVNVIEAMDLSADYILFGEKTEYGVSLFEQLEKMDIQHRKRAENAFAVLLPFIR